MKLDLNSVVNNHMTKSEIIEFNNSTTDGSYSSYIRLLKFDKKSKKLVADIDVCQIKGGKLDNSCNKITLTIWGTDYPLEIANDGELLSKKSREFLIKL